MDYIDSARWYKLAASNACIDAFNRLSDIYYDGKGVNKDIIKSHMWANLYISNLKSEHEGRRLFELREKAMTSQQILQAQKMARECQARNFKSCD